MSKTVFILGAGCSAAAGAPLMAGFLDTAEAVQRSSHVRGNEHVYFETVFTALDQLQGVYSKSTIDLLNVESVFAAFEMAEILGYLRNIPSEKLGQLVPAIKNVIVRTLEESIIYKIEPGERGYIVRAPHPYEAFIELLSGQKRSVSVITFNYDVALDYAFHVKRKTLNYCLDDAPREGMHVLKLHGSLNWVACVKCQKIVARSIADLELEGKCIERRDDEEARFIASERTLQISCSSCPSAQLNEIAIVPPTWNKATTFRIGMQSVWQAAARHLAEAEEIFVLGYSVPPTDHFFHYLYGLGTMSSSRLKRFWVFNPDKSVEPRYRNLLGPTADVRFIFFRKRFAPAINSLSIYLANGHMPKDDELWEMDM
jgi:hypothetical protein